MKVYLSGSTQENNTGVGTYGTEEQRMQYLSDRVKDYILKGKGKFEVFRNKGSMSLSDTIENSNDLNPDIHVAIHSNAGGGKGTECFYSNYPVYSQKSHKLAKSIYDKVAPITVSADRGCIPDTSYREVTTIGYAECRETNAIACILEVMFHDNYIDVSDYFGKIELIAEAIAVGIYNYAGVEYQKNGVPLEKKSRYEILKETTQTYDKWEEILSSIPNTELLIQRIYYKNKNL